MKPIGESERQQAFVDLYRRNYPRVLAYARRRVPEAAARDVTAEAFTVAWRRLEEASAGGLPWLYRTAHLVLANHERGERRLARVASRLRSLPSEPDVPDPAHVHAERQAVLDALRRLPGDQRELVLLVVWEQLDVRTAAAVVGCSAGAAAVRLHRGRHRLRALLAPLDPDRAATTVEVTP